uniref:Uncharacterized protein n=2 Tax=Halamphora TaxID=1242273 RepID=A0A516ZB38_9STRA|nr:hypothetical protein [Halamphora americana]YP_009686296.1 hypothetical protein [Halamphora calidilacuna]QDR24911.1 hypothetical protein [Halamphora americana]QDR25033.1 hypothetical protein [Halamphora calidilacuna]
MNQILFENRCKCNEEISVVKKRKLTSRSEGKPLQYPKSTEIKCKTFQIKYDGKLSLLAKFILNSFQNKYIYYGIDDILYQFRFDSNEYERLLAILYSPIISLQNNYSINFFDIWVNEIYIEEDSKPNKFLSKESQPLSQFTYITVKFFYKTKVPTKKQESLW